MMTRKAHILGVVPVDNSKFPEKKNWFQKYNVAPINTSVSEVDKMLQNLLLVHHEESTPLSFKSFKVMLGAAYQGGLKTLQYYHNSKVSLNLTTDNGINCLCAAVLKNQISVIGWLLSEGVTVNVTSTSIHPLWICCSDGLLDTCLELLKAGADVNWQDDMGRTALMAAAQYGQGEIINILLQHGADSSSMSIDGHSAADFAVFYGQMAIYSLLVLPQTLFASEELMIATQSENVDTVHCLNMSLGYDINEPDSNGNTPLMSASNTGNVSVVRYLLENGASLEIKNKQGMTAFLFSCYAADHAVSTLLISKSFRVCEVSDYNSNTPMIIAASLGNFELVKLLLQKTEVVNNANVDGITPLMAASANGHVEVVNLLLCTAKVNLISKNGFTALCLAHLQNQTAVIELYKNRNIPLSCSEVPKYKTLFAAISGNNMDVVLDLLPKGVEASFRNLNSITLPMVACYHGNKKMLEVLLKQGTNVTERNHMGCTALHYAIDGDNIKVIDLLLAEGLTFEDEDGIGQTVLHKSVLSGSLELVTRVVKLGAMLNHPDNAGNTALTLAVKKEFHDITSFLISLGACKNSKTRDNVTALDIAKQTCNVRIQNLLEVSNHHEEEYIAKGIAFLEFCELERTEIVKNQIANDSSLVNFCDPSNEDINPLFIACRKDNLTLLSLLHDNGANLNCKRKHGATLLRLACCLSDVHIVTWLVKHGSYINAVTDEGITPLMHAVHTGKTEVTRYLIQNGAFLYQRTLNDETAISISAKNPACDVLTLLLEHGLNEISKSHALMCSIFRGNMDHVKLLLDYHVDINTPVILNGTTLLMLAAQHGHFNIVKCLVEHGADIYAVTSEGQNVIDVALGEQHTEIVEWLQSKMKHPDPISGVDCGECLESSSSVSHNCSPAVTEGNVAQVLLLECCLSVHNSNAEEIVHQMVINGAELDKTNDSGESPIAIAVKNRNYNMVECLANLGADVEMQDNKGLTPLMYACKNNDETAVNILIKYKADVLTRDNQGHSAVHYAREHRCKKVLRLISKPLDADVAGSIHSGDVSALKQLIQDGIDVNYKDNKGYTHLHSAIAICRHNQSQIIDKLCSAGADLNITDSQGLSPLHTGFLAGNIMIVEQLLKHGAKIHANGSEILADIGNSQDTGALELALKYEFDLCEAKDHSSLLLDCVLAVGNTTRLQSVLAMREHLDRGQLLIKCVQQGQVPMCASILDLGMDVNYCDKDGTTALLVAAKIGDAEAVTLLLERNIGVRIKNGKGMDALCVALQNSQYEVARMLCCVALVTVDENYCCVMESKRERDVPMSTMYNSLIHTGPQPEQWLRGSATQWTETLSNAYHMITSLCSWDKPTCIQAISRGWNGPIIYFHVGTHCFLAAGKYISKVTSSVTFNPYIDACYIHVIIQRDDSHSLVGDIGIYQKTDNTSERKSTFKCCAMALVKKNNVTAKKVDEHVLNTFNDSLLYSIGCFVRNIKQFSDEMWLLTSGDWLPPTYQNESVHKCGLSIATEFLLDHDPCILSEECFIINDVFSMTSVNLFLGRVCSDRLHTYNIPELKTGMVFDGENKDLLHREVTKTGFITGSTRGRIIDASVTFRHSTGMYYYNTFIVAPLDSSQQCFAEPGDTGSLVVDASNNIVLGMVFAGQRKYCLPSEGRVYYNVVFCLKLDCALRYLTEKMKFSIGK